ncbi:DUF3300 domain-containing protein [Salinimonas marina]|uniref:DUF3300 domain-containing protein n=1 Tax=Salinimonas marina TaxID=2785918 RepID=A0A7S9HD38_9ALTE|nr:DUF3300 domain-containing protein [Salinimonas marina]QPG05795.1 DUF3300 domain-containing protein [Salinimonas marina]
MKLSTVALLTGIAVAASGFSLPVHAQSQISGSYHTETQAPTLDALLAPIALYPDTILTHILIASTYPLEVVAADRWRQDNLHLSDDAVARSIEKYNWDPSVKALVLFTDVLHTMAEDLSWLDALGQQVLASQSEVLSRVQVLRQQALAAGNLQSNRYQQVTHTHSAIVIHPVSRHTVYLPYYDTRVIYGAHWRHHPPTYWHRPAHYHRRAGFYWSPGIHFSAIFDFGAIHWAKRYVVVNRQGPRHYRYHSPVKRVKVKDYQRWQPQHRTIRKHSTRVVRQADVSRFHKSPRVTQSKRVTTADTYPSAQRPAAVKRVAKSDYHSANKQVHKPVNKQVNNQSTPTVRKPHVRSQQQVTRSTQKVRHQRSANRHRDGRTIKRHTER